MKKIISVILTLVLLFTLNIFASAENVLEISAKSAVVISADTCEVVYSKNMNEQHSMASTTKIMSSVIALEYGAVDEMQKVTTDMISVEGSSIGLLDGDEVSLKTLIKGMLLESGNDAANAVAHIVGGNIPDFVKMMNNKAKEIGMYSTSFETPSGLDGENHYSTAFDMAVLGAYAIKNPEFRSICEDESDVVYYGNPPYRRVFTNHNKLLNLYEGAFGIKTGFTKKSGRCLVSAVCKDGKTLVAVTLNAPDDWNDHIKMYDYAFKKVNKIQLTEDLSDIKLKIVGGTKNFINVEMLTIPQYTTVENNFEYIDKIYIKQFEYAPVKKGDVVGKIEFDHNNIKIYDIPVCASETVDILSKK